MSLETDIEKAQRITRGEDGTPQDLLALAKRLKNENYFGLAWRVIECMKIDASHPLWKMSRQQMAICIYKDPDLPSDERLDFALEVLRSCENLSTTTDRETLGITGGAYKRMWEEDGQRANLEKSLSFYRRGHESPEKDQDGYCGINAAFLLDLIASKEREGGNEAIAAERVAQAREIRATITAAVEPRVKDSGAWWQYATLAEASVCVGDLSKMQGWLALAAQCSPREWELESMVRQLATLARLQSDQIGDGGVYRREAERMLQEALHLSEAAVRSGAIGKVGLALSGGGMRAALYHIGVLARLAELGVLRHLDVISCVSGGSIAGAYYYLKLKQLIESKADAEITRADYMKLVAEMADEFMAGVQQNIRTRVAASFRVNLRMIFSDTYSRTERAGELYEEYLYQQITKSDEPILLRNLLICPKGEKRDFRPKYDNWRRANKVPILVLNATTLNTGHKWQFTSTFIGEPPRPRNGGIDSIYRLRRMYISADAKKNEAPGDYPNVRLGLAVGSSAAVPGLFEPITLKNLYRDRTVRLADGGVHDNQGLASLFEQSCKVVLVSDASGQMKATDTPSRGIFGVLKRADDVLQARLREAQYAELAARRRSGLLQGSMFIHLTKDLVGDDVDWIDCDDPARKTTPPALTPYGVDRTIQRQLAEVRTDLDSFTDAESYALMMSGYLMTVHDFNADNVPTLAKDAVPDERTWKFFGARAALTKSDVEENRRMTTLLSISDRLAFKIWYQKPWLKRSGLAMLGALMVAGAWLTYLRWDKAAVSVTYGAIGTFVLGLIATKLGLAALKYLDVRKTVGDIVLGVSLATLGTVLARLHLHVFDPLFLRMGRWAPADVPAERLAIATAGPTLPVAGDAPKARPDIMPPQPAAQNEIKKP